MDGILSWFQEKDLTETVANFPEIFEQAVTDWAKFKAGYKAGLFDEDDAGDVLDWFNEFPRLWETIKPNFEGADPAFTDKVNNWTKSLGSNLEALDLGIAPIIIAGVAIAAIFGVGGAVWAIGYAKKQHNISTMIDNVTAGKLPASVLETAVREEHASILGDATGLIKFAVIGAALYLAYPLLQKVVKGAR